MGSRYGTPMERDIMRSEKERKAFEEGREVESNSALADLEFYVRYAIHGEPFMGVTLDKETLKIVRDHFKQKHNNNHG